MNEINIAVIKNKYKNDNSHILKTSINNKYSLDVWNKIQVKLDKLNKYKYNIDYIDVEQFDVNYSNIIKLLINDYNYDVIVDELWITRERLKHGIPTLPIGQDSIGYLQKKKWVILKKLYETFILILPIILLLLSFGVIVGIFLHYTEPHRAEKFKYPLRRSILTGIAAFFGEPGYLSENSTLHIKGILMVILSFIIIFFISAYVQYVVVSKVFVGQKDTKFKYNTFKNNKIGIPKNSIIFEKINSIDNMNVIIDSEINLINKLKNNKIDKILITNTDKFRYDIYNLDYVEDNTYRPNLHFYVNKKRVDLLNEINIIIAEMYQNKSLYNLCKNYYKNFKAYCDNLV